MQAAAAKGLRVGCAPDTFLGGAHQACRYAIDAGAIGVPVAGAASVLSHGMEHWHPNPAFFYQHGGGPIHDMGPYYVTQLVNLLGPVSRVTAQASGCQPDAHDYQRATCRADHRSGGSDHGQRRAVASPAAPTSRSAIRGTFGSTRARHWRSTAARAACWRPIPTSSAASRRSHGVMATGCRSISAAHPYGVPNRTTRTGAHVADYRIIGLLDMAAAIRARPSASRQRHARPACAGGARCVRAFVARGPSHRHRDAVRSAGEAAARFR